MLHLPLAANRALKTTIVSLWKVTKVSVSFLPQFYFLSQGLMYHCSCLLCFIVFKIACVVYCIEK